MFDACVRRRLGLKTGAAPESQCLPRDLMVTMPPKLCLCRVAALPRVGNLMLRGRGLLRSSSERGSQQYTQIDHPQCVPDTVSERNAADSTEDGKARASLGVDDCCGKKNTFAWAGMKRGLDASRIVGLTVRFTLLSRVCSVTAGRRESGTLLEALAFDRATTYPDWEAYVSDRNTSASCFHLMT